jgi:hypothetical protein
MKDTLLPVAVVIALVAGIWYYINVRAQHDAIARAFSADQGAAAPSVKKKAPTIPHTPKPGRVAEASPGPVPVAEAEPTPKSVFIEVAKPALPPNPVPTGTLGDVKLGMDATQVVELLGEPKLTAVTTEGGILFETYVYAHAPDRVWLIQLRAGRVEARNQASAIIRSP